jgi:peptidoglycan hydrolase CwlO-like protein
LYEVLKGINTHGSLKAIEEEIEKLAVKKSKLEVMVKELSNQVQERRALIEGLGKKAKELFESSVEEVRKTIDL